jgi:hypothetical protein
MFYFSQILTSFLVIINAIWRSNNYGKIIRFLKVWGFNVIPAAFVCLNVVHTGYAGPTDQLITMSARQVILVGQMAWWKGTTQSIAGEI